MTTRRKQAEKKATQKKAELNDRQKVCPDDIVYTPLPPGLI